MTKQLLMRDTCALSRAVIEQQDIMKGTMAKRFNVTANEARHEATPHTLPLL